MIMCYYILFIIFYDYYYISFYLYFILSLLRSFLLLNLEFYWNKYDKHNKINANALLFVARYFRHFVLLLYLLLVVINSPYCVILIM